MMIKVTKADKNGKQSEGAINPRFMTSALYVEEQGLTAINMEDQPTIWVTDSPTLIALKVNKLELLNG